MYEYERIWERGPRETKKRDEGGAPRFGVSCWPALASFEISCARFRYCTNARRRTAGFVFQSEVSPKKKKTTTSPKGKLESLAWESRSGRLTPSKAAAERERDIVLWSLQIIEVCIILFCVLVYTSWESMGYDRQYRATHWKMETTKSIAWD